MSKFLCAANSNIKLPSWKEQTSGLLQNYAHVTWDILYSFKKILHACMTFVMLWQFEQQ